MLGRRARLQRPPQAWAVVMTLALGIVATICVAPAAVAAEGSPGFLTADPATDEPTGIAAAVGGDLTEDPSSSAIVPTKFSLISPSSPASIAAPLETDLCPCWARPDGTVSEKVGTVGDPDRGPPSTGW